MAAPVAGHLAVEHFVEGHHSADDQYPEPPVSPKPIAGSPHHRAKNTTRLRRIDRLRSAGGARPEHALCDDGSGFSFDDKGEHALKGVPENWQLYRVAPES